MKRAFCITSLALFCFLISFPPLAGALPFSITIGDNDGYGFGVPDNGTAVWPGLGPGGRNYDGRSAAEAAALNGAQFTDVYSAIFTGGTPPFGPNTSDSGDVIFPFAGSILSATLTVDMGGFQALDFGQISVAYNDIVQPDLFNFNDGEQGTAVRDFMLPASAIGAANSDKQFVLGLDRAGSDDFIAFDFFRLEGDIDLPSSSTIPEPATMLLLASGLVALAGLGHKKFFKN